MRGVPRREREERGEEREEERRRRRMKEERWELRESSGKVKDLACKRGSRHQQKRLGPLRVKETNRGK